MNTLENFFTQIQPGTPAPTQRRDPTKPIRGTVAHIDGYPRKLIIYRMLASPYWQVRYFEDGRSFKRSTRTTEKQDAIQRAKEIFSDIVVNRVRGRVVSRLRGRFETVALEQMELQQVRLLRGEVTQATQENDSNRLRRDLLPFFRDYEVKDVDYNAIDAYINQLTLQTG